jgi:plasmid stability protein
MEVAVSDLLIRKIPAHMKRRIKERAQARGRSMSEEARALIEKGLKLPDEERNVGTFLEALVPTKYRGDDLVFEYHGEMPKPPDFE